jgi:amino acid adenylation domain-containing protein
MVVAVLAIMKAGGGYVPLDPSFPPDRLAYMVEDSGLGVLVTETALSGRLRLPGGVREVRVDGDRAAIEARPARAPETGVGCRDTIYVIYTSGSTGKPKGVVLEHRSVVNFLETMAVEPGLEPDDVLLAVTTLSFDIAGLELYLPLLRGATVVVADRATTTDPARLLEAIVAHGVTVMQATPATWRMLVDGGWEPGATPALRAFCGGEALPPALAEQLVARAAEAWNLYGPTETTIWSTVQRVQPGAPVSIGRAIANTTLYVLDGRLQPVPIGVAGELLIGGDGLARGYHDRAELTAERFVADPFSERPDARLYRTGDLVRWRADGRIEFIGRVDHQVKVRGFRIELGEIEAVLGRQPAVEEAVVLAVDDDRGQKQLVAYVTPAAGAQASRTELRRAVGDDLPNYMVPASVVVLDAMPRTPNGKTDRKALPAPDFTDVEREVPFAAPRNDTERRLVALWEETLGITPIGVDDDLFTLGVDSLTTARLVGQMEQAFKVDLAVGTMFSAHTPAALAELLSAGVQKPRWRSLVVITPEHPGSTSSPLFCVHGGAGTVLLYAELARRLGPDRPLYALHAQGLYGHDAVHTSIPDMAAAYVRQIREVQPHGPYAVIGYCFGGHVAHEMGLLLRAAGEAVDLVGYINAPSVDYLREHKPLFDREGAVTGEGGARLRVAPPEPTGPPPLAARVRRRARRDYRNLRMRYAVRFGRPLPASMREEWAFQLIAHRAERAYTPGRLDVTGIVWRAEGLYFADDLGWGAFVGGSLHCVEIPGPQPIPRITMNEPFVSHIAETILALREDPAMASDAVA